jgi:ribosomal protein S18 acetylase RimI-like enzyme
MGTPMTQPDAPTGEFTVRPMSRDDVPAMLAFYNDLAEFVVRTYRPYGYDVTETILLNGPAHRVANDEEIGFVLVDEAAAVWGHAFIRALNTDRPEFGVGVHQAVLGKRMGRSLTEAVLAEARARNIPQVHLIVVKDNTPAWTLYESVGFVITGEQKGIGGGVENDGLTYLQMRWTLG